MCSESVANGFKVDQAPEDENETTDVNKEESNDSDKSGTPVPDKPETAKHAKLKQQNSGEKRKRKKRKKKKGNSPMVIETDSTTVANVGVPAPREIVQMSGEPTGNQKANEQETKSNPGVLRTHVEKKFENSSGIKTDLNENCESNLNNYGTNCESSHVDLCNDETVEVTEKYEELNKQSEGTSCAVNREHNLVSNGPTTDSHVMHTLPLNETAAGEQVNNDNKETDDTHLPNDKQEINDEQNTNDKQEINDKQDTKDKQEINDKQDTKDEQEINDKQDTKDEHEINDKQDTKNDQEINDKQDTKDEQEINDKQDTKDEQEINDKQDTKDEHEINDKQDTKNDQEINDKQDTKDEQEINDKQDTRDEQEINDKQDTKDEQKINDKQDTKDEQEINDKQDTKDEQEINDKQDTKDEQEINDKQDTKDEQEINDKQDTKDEQEINDKQDTKDEQEINDKQDTKDEQEINDKQDTKDEQEINDKQDSKDEQEINDKQDTKDRQEINDKQDTKDKQEINDKQDTKDEQVINDKQDTKDEQVINDKQDTNDNHESKDKQEAEDKQETNYGQDINVILSTDNNLVTNDKYERIENQEVNYEREIIDVETCNTIQIYSDQQGFVEKQELSNKHESKHEREEPMSESFLAETCQSMTTQMSTICEMRHNNIDGTKVVPARNFIYDYECKGMLTREAMLDNINTDESTLCMETIHQANITGDATSSGVSGTIVSIDLDNFRENVETSTSCSRQHLATDSRMSDSQLLEQFQQQHEAMTKLQSYIQEQKVAANLLTTSLRSKLKHRDHKVKQMKEQYEQQMTTVLSRLLYLEGHLQREHKQMSEILQDKDDIIRRQKAAITDLTQKNDRLLKALQESYSQDNGIVKPGIVHENGSIPIQDHGNKVILRAAKAKNGDKTPSKVRFSAMKERLRRHKSSLELYHGDRLETLDEGGLRYGSQENLVTQNFDRKERCRSLVDYPCGLRDVDESHNESPDSCFGDSSEMSHNDSKSSSTSSLVNIVERSGSGSGKPLASYGFNELSKSRSVPHALPTVAENDTGNNFKERPLSLPSVELLVKEAPAASPSSSTTSLTGSKSSLPPPSPTQSSPPSESNPFKSFKNVFKRRGSKKKKSGIAGNQESNSEALKQHFKKFNLP